MTILYHHSFHTGITPLVGVQKGGLMDTVIRGRVGEATKRLVEAHTSRGGDRVEDIAAALGMTRKQLDNRLQGNTHLTVVDLRALTHLLEDDQLIQFVCTLCGGSFLPTPHEEGPTRPQESYRHALSMLATATRETGEGLSVSMDVLQGQIATAEQKAAVTKELTETMAAIGQLLGAINGLPEFSAPRTFSLSGESR